ncbi:hypothetical protein EXIGLDRAFT_696720 [Exidia glandulosa HHB12029]|uniref:Uncharacterized protein n=1 Tax=Exidia glandulosa HHB12029 TaxID=1314781 RepID=A0A165N2I9_EXIGL|nr:hypothetical protein EXIGLDRAFT_696720 [Exidia glandulosa HHB12029]
MWWWAVLVVTEVWYLNPPAELGYREDIVMRSVNVEQTKAMEQSFQNEELHQKIRDAVLERDKQLEAALAAAEAMQKHLHLPRRPRRMITARKLKRQVARLAAREVESTSFFPLPSAYSSCSLTRGRAVALHARTMRVLSDLPSTAGSTGLDAAQPVAKSAVALHVLGPSG